MARDYSYDKKYNAQPEQKKRRAQRNKARRLMIKKHGKTKLKGKDVHHKDNNPSNNNRRNLAITFVKYNRSKK
jgi:hypothetical protein